MFNQGVLITIQLLQLLHNNILLSYASKSESHFVVPGPKVKASSGAIWPKPAQQIIFNTYAVVRPTVFKFETINHTCDILEQAIERYVNIIETSVKENQKYTKFGSSTESWLKDSNFLGYLDSVQIELKNKCEALPYLGMDESYTLTIQKTTAKLESSSIWGILHGLESFSQMLVLAQDGQSLQINSTEIEDKPRFSHRGLLLDTARHYISLPIIYKILDGMSMNKLNVFHWHIVDDESFPYVSIKFPELSEKGAYHPTLVYTQENVKNVIEYARLRGIRVIPEFDSPAHTRSWGLSHPEVLTKCGKPYNGELGTIDPTKEDTYVFLKELLTEIAEVFPDKYSHLGGDEVEFDCWRSAAYVHNYMKSNNIQSFQQLEERYIQKIIYHIRQLKKTPIVWQEVFKSGAKLPSDTVVQIWRGHARTLLMDITKAGLSVIVSTGWYLSRIAYGGDWEQFYNRDPHSFRGSKKQMNLVLGGEACMWSEFVDDINVLQRIFPRVSAIAERLWSQSSVTKIDDAKKRLEEQTCRMRKRGIPAQPGTGAGFCI